MRTSRIAPCLFGVVAFLLPVSATYALDDHRLSIFLDQGRNYRTLTTDLPGHVEKLIVNGSTIVIDALTLGPKDPRCCPSVKMQQRFQWTGSKLVMLK